MQISDENKTDEKPEGFCELVEIINKSHFEPNNNEFQEEVLKKSITYIFQNKERHWFCDKYLFIISTHTLILFSFSNNDILQKLLPMIDKNLDNCIECVKGFNQSKSKLKYDFTINRKIGYKLVDHFLNIISKWEGERVNAYFENFLDNIEENESKKNDRLKFYINECFYGPDILFVNSKLLINFEKIIVYLKNKKENIFNDELNSGLINLIFDGSPFLKQVCEDLLKKLLMQKCLYTKDIMNECVVDQFHNYLYKIQDAKYYNFHFSTKFWSFFYDLFDLIDNETFLTYFNNPKDKVIYSEFKNIRFYSLIRVLMNNLMSFLEVPLTILLKVFNKFLLRFKTSFWNHTNLFTYANILDTLLLNKKFSNQLFTLPIEKNDIQDDLLDEITSWFFNLIESLVDPHKQTASTRISDFFLRQTSFLKDRHLSQDEKNKKESFFVSISCKILSKSFTNENLIDATTKNSYVDLLTKRDLRCVIDNNSICILDFCLTSKSDISVKLISKSLSYDISLLTHNSGLLLKETIPTSFDIFCLLWQNLITKPIHLNLNVISNVIKSFKNVVYAIKFIPKKKEDSNKKLAEAIKCNNNNIEKIFKYLNDLFEKISLGNVSSLQSIFSDFEIQLSVWSCIFFPIINQSTIDLLSQIFDIGVGGRFEIIQKLSINYLDFTIRAININLKKLIEMQSFEPCPKALRILMDFLKIFADPLNGLILNNNQISICFEEIKNLWENCWNFLIMIYKKTLDWANDYFLSDLIEFTRDTLDLSHYLLDSFRVFQSNIEQFDCEIKHFLFKSFIETFHFVIVWLKLGDTSLLKSCLDLVFKGFDLTNDLNKSIDNTFLEVFINYGLKAKNYNNKLDEKQKFEILAKARQFNEPLVEKLILEVQQKKIKSKSTLSIDKRLENESIISKSLLSKKPLEQQTLTKFDYITSDPTIVTSIKQKNFKSLNIDLIRKELQSSRSINSRNKNNIYNPAPSRPPGFNSRKPTVGRSLNALKKKKLVYDSSDDDDETDILDLFVKKKSKVNYIDIDLNGKPITPIENKFKLTSNKTNEDFMRLRLNIDLKPFYLKVLSLNFNSKNDYPTDNLTIYKKTKDFYEDENDYYNYMEPLLMLEFWKSIQSSKNTVIDEYFEFKIGSRTSIDGFFDVYTSIKKSSTNTTKINDSDILILCHLNPKNFDSKKSICNYIKQENTKTCIAKVKEIKTASADYLDVTLRVCSHGSLMSFLTPKSEIIGMKTTQMVTVEREFSTLKGLKYYDLKEKILNPEPNKIIDQPSQLLKEIEKKLNVNESQANAILGSYDREGFTLIQGPPGTGKTKTILGIIALSLNFNGSCIDVNQNGKNISAIDKKKILICAPSNAAIDEIALRLRNGIMNVDGQLFFPKIVRLGKSDSVNSIIKSLTLEELVESEMLIKLNETVFDYNVKSEYSKCIEEREKTKDLLKQKDLDEKQKTVIEKMLKEINKNKNDLSKKLDEQREKVSIAYRTREIEKRNLQAKILSEAQVICSTLSGSANDVLSSLSMILDQVIIDEACQAIELSSIIPLRYGCKKCIMVGDPKQLPPTVLSKEAAKLNYDQSLFVRFQKAASDSVYLLDVQYRMHPEISRLPNFLFYNMLLKDGDNLSVSNKRIWHDHHPFTPYHFFDIHSRHEHNDTTKSLFNVTESLIALEIVECLLSIQNTNLENFIGIISPYKEQIKILRRLFSQSLSSEVFNKIEFNTIDGFQGQEKEVIIMSCVRASDDDRVGFLSDVRRINVAFTRAKTSLWVLGNVSSLCKNNIWKKLIDDAKKRNLITAVHPGFFKKKNILLQSSNKKGMRHSDSSSTINKEFSSSIPQSDLDSEFTKSKRLNNKNNLFPMSHNSHLSSDYAHFKKKKLQSNTNNPAHNINSDFINIPIKPINSGIIYSLSNIYNNSASQNHYFASPQSPFLLYQNTFNQNLKNNKNMHSTPSEKLEKKINKNIQNDR